MTSSIISGDLLRRGRDAQDSLARALQRGMTLPGVLPNVQRMAETLFEVFNRTHARRYLVRLASEVVPTHPRYVSAVRARMGMLMELYLAAIWNSLIEVGKHPGWRISAN